VPGIKKADIGTFNSRQSFGTNEQEGDTVNILFLTKG
jgi:hypothetical protein